MNKLAITGATGFLAEELIRVLIEEGFHINAIARNEGKLVELKKKYKNLSIHPCPVEDYCLLKKATQNCIGVYHLASFKDVVLAESNPLKTIQSNIIGTLNILKLSMEINNLKYIISTSTDKAVRVSGVYGASKLMIEKLFHEFHEINGNNCKYRLVRYGNIFNSTGSVLTKWKESLLKNEKIILTDPNATRFFLTREEAVGLILKCLKEAKNSNPFYPEMKSIEMRILLETMIDKYSTVKPNVSIIGLRKGENMHELIEGEISSNNAPRWTKQELMKII